VSRSVCPAAGVGVVALDQSIPTPHVQEFAVVVVSVADAGPVAALFHATAPV